MKVVMLIDSDDFWRALSTNSLDERLLEQLKIVAALYFVNDVEKTPKESIPKLKQFLEKKIKFSNEFVQEVLELSADLRQLVY